MLATFRVHVFKFISHQGIILILAAGQRTTYAQRSLAATTTRAPMYPTNILAILHAAANRISFGSPNRVEDASLIAPHGWHSMIDICLLEPRDSRRSADQPLGDEDVRTVRTANMHLVLQCDKCVNCDRDSHSIHGIMVNCPGAARMSLIFLLAISRAIHWFVEQPASSLLELAPYIAHRLSVCKVAQPVFRSFLSPTQQLSVTVAVITQVRVRICLALSWMGCWGHFFPKGSIAIGSVPEAQPKTSSAVVRSSKVTVGTYIRLNSQGL